MISVMEKGESCLSPISSSWFSGVLGRPGVYSALASHSPPSPRTHAVSGSSAGTATDSSRYWPAGWNTTVQPEAGSEK